MKQISLGRVEGAGELSYLGNGPGYSQGMTHLSHQQGGQELS